MSVLKLARYTVMITAGAMAATSLSASVLQNSRKSSDPLSMIRRVSPGTRTAGALPNKVRPKKVAVRRPVHHVAKVAVRRPKPVSAVLPTMVEGPLPIQLSSVPLATAAIPLPVAAPLVIATSSSHVIPFLVLPVALSVLTVGGGGGTSITSAAPEPETWLMMILGFGFLGSTMRRRRRAERETMLTALA